MKPKFTWYPSYSKKGNQPYDCKLVFTELGNLYPERNIKSLDGSSKLLKEYDDFFERFGNYEYPHQIDPQDDKLIFDSPEKGSNELEEGKYEALYESNFEKQIKEKLNNGLELPDVAQSNIIIVGNPYQISNNTMRRFLAHTYNGNTLFIADEKFSFINYLLKIKTKITPVDTSHLTFQDETNYYYKNKDISHFFSTNISPTNILAKNKQGQPVLVRVPFGAGNLILSTTPKAFTNYYLLKNNNARFIEKVLGLMPNVDTYWTDRYIKSNGESTTPSKLDFIRKNPPLWWAFCLALTTLITFMVLATKRKQRLIPDFNIPKNSTIEFIQIMAQLHLQTGGHTLIANKKITYFLDYIRKHYHLDTSRLDEEFYTKLTTVSQRDPNQVRFLIKLLNTLHTQKSISKDEVIRLHKAIEKFKSPDNGSR